jgi:hypothetical protein
MNHQKLKTGFLRERIRKMAKGYKPRPNTRRFLAIFKTRILPGFTFFLRP